MKNGGGVVIVRGMSRRIIAGWAGLFLLAGCTGHGQRSPALSAPPMSAAPAEPTRSNVLQEAGDATWRVVTSPARIVTPQKNVQQPPETYDPPAAIITRRNWSDEKPATQPDHP